MKIRSVTHNNRKKAFEVKTSRKTFQLPYSKVDPQPGVGDPIVQLFVSPVTIPKPIWPPRFA